MSRQRSVRNACVGNTLPPLGLAGASLALSAGAALVPSAGTPIKGPRSTMRNCLDNNLPVSLGRGAPSANVMSPCRSLLPTLPLKSL
ncbi:hypothetical protein D3C71_1385860 [compost metagenome]